MLGENNMRKIILVEGKDDKAFVEAILPKSEIREILVDKLGGLNEETLKKALARLKNELLKNPFDKLGIVIDHDRFSVNERLLFVNKCLSQAWGVRLTKANNLEKYPIEGFEIEIACFFIGVEQSGSLDTILRQIPSESSTISNCLIGCLPNNTLPKELDKAWIYYYIRWDICDAEDRIHGKERVTLAYSLNPKNAWKLDSPLLDSLRVFLNQF